MTSNFLEKKIAEKLSRKQKREDNVLDLIASFEERPVRLITQCDCGFFSLILNFGTESDFYGFFVLCVCVWRGGGYRGCFFSLMLNFGMRV